MPRRAPDQPHYVNSYTVCLYLLAAFTLFGVALQEMLIAMAKQDSGGEASTFVFRFVQSVELILFVCILSVAILRSKRSAMAEATTPAVSILVAFLFPFGTAMFIWWVGWVRHRERFEE